MFVAPYLEYRFSQVAGCGFADADNLGDRRLLWIDHQFSAAGSERVRSKKRDTKMSSSETVGRNPASVASFRTPRPALICEMPPYRGLSSATRFRMR
jgi:hypothetical protein